MNRSRFRTILLVFLLLAICGLYFFESGAGPWADTSLEGQTRKLQSVWAFKRREAAASLAQFSAEADRVGPELLKALRDPDKEVRSNAIRSLKEIGNPPMGAVPVLVEFIRQDQDPRNRQEAVSVLGATKDPNAAAALVEALDDRDPGVRLAATLALSLHRDPAASAPAIDKLYSLLSSMQPEESKLAAIQTLGAISGDQERFARSLTEILAKDHSPAVRNSAAFILRTKSFGFEIPALIAALDDQSAQVRLTAGAGLGWIGLKDDRTVPVLCRAALKADELTREGMSVNIEMLRFDAPTGSSSAEQTTRRMQAAVKELSALLDHKESAGREAAVTVLTRLVGSYNASVHPALLEPAREALKAILRVSPMRV